MSLKYGRIIYSVLALSVISSCTPVSRSSAQVPSSERMRFSDGEQDILQGFRDGPLREDYAYYFHREWSYQDMVDLYLKVLAKENSIHIERGGIQLSRTQVLLNIAASRSFMDFEDAVRTRFLSAPSNLKPFLYEVSRKYGYSLIISQWLTHDSKYLNKSQYGVATKCLKLYQE